MIRSMTGYGRKEEENGSLRATVEIRAVNHRYADIVVRLPKAWSMLEEPVRKTVLPFVKRGRAEVTVTIEGESQATAGISVDWNLAQQYVHLSQEMSKRFSLDTSLTVKDLLLMPGVVHTSQTDDRSQDTDEWILSLVRQAGQDLLSMKVAEGKQLHLDLVERLAQIGKWVDEIRDLAPQVSEEYRKRLQQRIAEMTDSLSSQLEPQRMLQEVALFAEKSDISEELTRLQSHCNQFAQKLEDEEAVGRKLDFLLQEMNREANTIASKANHMQIQHLAVEIKTELEKMREQVQNIE
ncbi:YicC/YloC family endoribonuclease [Brevibacillus sp. TJ4]|uniref:YicC/YloC family endoribonuclease n=1 Tax=Brevibacillus sp. TJ4 TaxID=3234853 RepID=UPI0037CDAD41